MTVFVNPSSAGTPFDASSYTDISGTPGAGTVNTNRGKAAIAAAAASVVITSPQTTANSTVIAFLNGAAADATLTSILRVTCAAGSFTITGNAGATGAVNIGFIVLN